MNRKVLVSVLLPATQRSYEFRVPLELDMGQVADLMAAILEARERTRYAAPPHAGLMALEGEHVGLPYKDNELVGDLVAQEEIADGQPLALI